LSPAKCGERSAILKQDGVHTNTPVLTVTPNINSETSCTRGDVFTATQPLAQNGKTRPAQPSVRPNPDRVEGPSLAAIK